MTHLMMSLNSGTLYPDSGPSPILTPLQNNMLMSDAIDTSVYGELGGVIQPLTVFNQTNAGCEPTLSDYGVISGTQDPLAVTYPEMQAEEFYLLGVKTNTRSVAISVLALLALYYADRMVK